MNELKSSVSFLENLYNFYLDNIHDQQLPNQTNERRETDSKQMEYIFTCLPIAILEEPLEHTGVRILHNFTSDASKLDTGRWSDVAFEKLNIVKETLLKHEIREIFNKETKAFRLQKPPNKFKLASAVNEQLAKLAVELFPNQSTNSLFSIAENIIAMEFEENFGPIQLNRLQLASRATELVIEKTQKDTSPNNDELCIKSSDFIKDLIDSLSSNKDELQQFLDILLRKLSGRINAKQNQSWNLSLLLYEQIYLMIKDEIPKNLELKSLRDSVETAIFNALTFSPDEMLRKILPCSLIDNPSAAILCSFLYLTIPPPINLKKFVIAFDQIYIRLINIKESLDSSTLQTPFFTASKKALINKIVQTIRGVESATNGSTISLADKNNSSLLKRIPILLETTSKLLGIDIQLDFKMKIKNDLLISLLYQILSFTPQANKQLVPQIKSWIESNPSYDFSNFSLWLENKFINQNPIEFPINVDPEWVYSQFIAETNIKI